MISSMPRLWRAVASLLLVVLCIPLHAQWRLATSNTTANLRGVHKAGIGLIWASGSNGTVLRSEDDGNVWQICTTPPNAAQLDFRAVFAGDANHAAVMSSGPGAASKLYETTDGCATWSLLFENPDPAGFWDALAFDGRKGYSLGDPVANQFAVYISDDLGKHWRRDTNAGLAPAPPGEGAFAASNSSLVILPSSEVLFGTGGPGGPHIFRKSPSSKRWQSISVPLAGGKDSAGVFSIAFRNDRNGVAVDGDYKDPAGSYGAAAWTNDGGRSWHGAGVFPSGYRSSVGWDADLRAWLTVGPNGSDISRDDGRTWRRFDSGQWNALSLPWVVGPAGRIASLDPASPVLRSRRAVQPSPREPITRTGFLR
jgi:photosystem II stability/assembly factor-like uncharacterized protein